MENSSRTSADVVFFLSAGVPQPQCLGHSNPWRALIRFAAFRRSLLVGTMLISFCTGCAHEPLDALYRSKDHSLPADGRGGSDFGLTEEKQDRPTRHSESRSRPSSHPTCCTGIGAAIGALVPLAITGYSYADDREDYSCRYDYTCGK